MIFCWIVIGIIGGISLFSGNNLNENFEFIQKISTDPFISSIALNPIIGFLIMEVLISLGIYTLTYLGITLVDKYGGIDKLQNKCNEVTKKIYGNQAKQGHNPC